MTAINEPETTVASENGSTPNTAPMFDPYETYGEPGPLRTFVGLHTDADMDEFKEHGMRAGVTTCVVAAAVGTAVGPAVAVGLVGYQLVRGRQVHRRYNEIRDYIASQDTSA